jgi:spore germination protein YaaH
MGLASLSDAPESWSGYDTVILSGGWLSYSGLSRPETAREQLDTIHANGGKALLQVTGMATALKGKPAELADSLAAAMEDGYDGLYLTFSQLRPENRASLTKLVQALPAKLAGKLLYVAVDAPVWQGKDYAAYDYAALGSAADCLVVRVEPYAKKAGGFVTAPPEPLEEVYYALSQLCRQVPADKLCLLLTTTGSVWTGERRTGTADADAISAMLADQKNTESYYSNRYAAAFLIQTDSKKQTVVWYLDQQAAQARAQLCALFGVSRVFLSDLDSVSPELLAGLM